MIKLNIYDDMSLKDVLVMGSHDYEEDEFFLNVEDHDLVSTKEVAEYNGTIDVPELKLELLEHPEHFTLDGRPITEISVHRWLCDTEKGMYQVSIILYN